jgi:hypothetical protein
LTPLAVRMRVREKAPPAGCRRGGGARGDGYVILT